MCCAHGIPWMGEKAVADVRRYKPAALCDGLSICFWRPAQHQIRNQSNRMMILGDMELLLMMKTADMQKYRKHANCMYRFLDRPAPQKVEI